jgi:hypothetical protein
MADHITRRAFLGAAGAVGLTASDALSQWPRRQVVWPCPPQPWPPVPVPPPGNTPPPPGLRVRQNVLSLGGAQFDSLRKGVAALKALPATDRRSWTFQAAIHGTDAPGSDPLWNQCEHGTLHFLTWHRMYLHYFERILRWAAQDDSLTLPYWDWVADPVLPEPFRNPADASNPLYDSPRAANSGAPLPPELGDDVATALDQLTFPPTPGVGFSPVLEGPHGAVHVLVGGPGGNMRFVSRSARDPIFWLHHANIDRLWDRWLNTGGGRANPTDPTFLDKEYTFADETGATRAGKVGDAIGSAQLGYRYDTEPAAVAGAAAPAAMAFAKAAPPRVAATSAAAENRDLPLEKVEAKPLQFEVERVKLNVVPEARPLLAARVAPQAVGGPRVVVAVEGVAADEPPAFLYGVYLNLPPGDPSRLSEQERRLHYVGGIDFFGKTRADRKAGGHAHGETFDATLDATRAVARLQQAGRWDPGAVMVAVLPLAPAPPNTPAKQVQAEAAASARKANVSYKRITLRVAP